MSQVVTRNMNFINRRKKLVRVTKFHSSKEALKEQIIMKRRIDFLLVSKKEIEKQRSGVRRGHPRYKA